MKFEHPDDLSEADYIKMYDDAKASDDEAIPLEQALKEVEEYRLRGKPLLYLEPFESVAEADWDASK